MKTNDQVQELYTHRASLYERLFVDRLGWGRELEAFLRRGEYLHDHSKVLDAGCGTGIITRILYRLALERDFAGVNFHAFDLTQSMLDIFHRWIVDHRAQRIELAQADVLEVGSLPSHWREHDLIVTSTMIEYLPEDSVTYALSNLRALLREDGILLAIVTRRNFITRWVAGSWWKVNAYNEERIEGHLLEAGFSRIDFERFSPRWAGFILALEARQ